LKTLIINNYKENEKAQLALQNLSRCAGQPLEMLDYKTPNLLDRVETMNPNAIVLTGSNFMLSKSDTQLVFQHEMQLVRESNIPLLGICFGHQLIGAAYGSRVADLGRTVRQFKEVKLLTRDPLFTGLPDAIRVSESHRQALSTVPESFLHLAESVTSRIEAIGHESRPVYGVQFHPERSDADHPHGRSIIQNFLSLAKV
jgi:GMP synthase (glutamine-hydrolysing)